MAGSTMAASIAIMARTQMTSISVNPPCLPAKSARPTGNVACGPRSAFLAVRAVGDDVIGTTLSGRSIDIGVPPGVGGDDAAFQIGAVPARNAAGTLHQRAKALRARRIASGIEEEKIERAGEAFDLDFGCLGLRFGQIVEHARANQTHDQTDDGN